MKTSCPHCGQHFEVEEPDLGKEADCMNCGKRFVLQASAEPPVSAPPASENTEAKQPEVNCYTGPLWEKKFIFYVFRLVVSILCVLVAFYKMYFSPNELQPIMFMLLALFIKPGGHDAK